MQRLTSRTMFLVPIWYFNAIATSFAPSLFEILRVNVWLRGSRSGWKHCQIEEPMESANCAIPQTLPSAFVKKLFRRLRPPSVGSAPYEAIFLVERSAASDVIIT